MSQHGSKTDPIDLLDIDEEEDGQAVAGDFDFLDLGAETKVGPESESDVEIIQIRERAQPDFGTVHHAPSNVEDDSGPSLGVIDLPWVFIPTCRIKHRQKVRRGDTIELRDTANHKGSALNSGDFFRIVFIIQNVQTDEIKLRGYRLRRTKYQGQIFDWKLNELVMLLEVSQDNSASAFEQGLEDLPVEEALQKRWCTITSKPYPFKTWRDARVPSTLRDRSHNDVRRWLFDQGPLACRWVHVNIKQSNGNSYSGIIRSVRINESDDHQKSQVCESTATICIDRKEASDEQRPNLPSKVTRFTFADVFCGVGGASMGAALAGLCIKWGLDQDELAIEAYSANFKEAFILDINAHDFPDSEFRKTLRVDILHLSPPCCYFSPAHTRDGRNDQANFEAIYTVGPILTKLRPRVVTLEQTYGLYTHEEHKQNFNLLMYDILKAGYDVRYKIQDMGEFGVPQRRKRLLIIAARRGTPLPPFPKPTHGPPGSGLKDFASVDDALNPLGMFGLPKDEYHQPDAMKRIDKEPYDPRTCMLSCITTSGGANHHPSGQRNFTARELSLCQSFPLDYVFTGCQTEAKKQIGNAFPPKMAEAMYKTIAQTLEAFDNGLITAEDEITDLNALLQSRGFELPDPRPSSLMLSGSPGSQTSPSKYRYLRKRDESSTPSTSTPSVSAPLFRRSNAIEPRQPRESTVKRQKRSRHYGLIDEDDEDDEDDDIVYVGASAVQRPQKRTKCALEQQHELQAAKDKGDYVELSD